MSPPSFQHALLLGLLQLKSELYYGKILELREAIEGWLDYVGFTRPQVTSMPAAF
jgi:hypothetical protein